MDATSTTSFYGTIERNDRAERMYSSVSDSRDEITERELLEDPSQDPEDEDTLSDDSLRLRVSDDEADTSQTGAKFELAKPCCSSEQTTSRDTATGFIDSDKKIPLSTETKQSIPESCESDSDKKYQNSTEPYQTLNEICIGGNRNMNRAWKAQQRRQRSMTHSPKRSSYHESFYARYNFGNSSIQKSPSYFNNQDNFGKPAGSRKHGSHWKHSKEKHFHDSQRNAQGDSVEEETPNPIPQQCSKSHMETEVGCVQPDHLVSDTASEKNHEDLSNADNEPHKECGSSPNQELIHGRETLAEFSAANSNRKDCENVSSSSLDSMVIPDNATDVESIASGEQCNDPISSSTNLDPPGSETITSIPPLNDLELTAPLSKVNETAVNNVPSLQSNSVESPDVGTTTTEADTGANLNVVEPVSDDTNANAECNRQKEIDVNSHAAQSDEGSNKAVDPLDTVKDLGSGSTPCNPEVAEGQLKEEPESNLQCSAVDGNLKIKRHDSSDEKKPDSKDHVKNEENIEDKQTETLLFDCKKLTKEASKIVVNHNDTVDDKDSITSNNKRKLSLDNEETEPTESVQLQKGKTLKNAKEIVSNDLICNETSVKSTYNTEQNVKEKSSIKLKSDTESQRIMKRSLSDTDSITNKAIRKKMKITSDSDDKVCAQQLQNLLSTDSQTVEKQTTSAEESNESPKPLHYVRKFFQRDMKGKLTKLKREDLEELIIQKLVETITMRSEIGRLREQARISERNQEATRIRCQQLSKQIKDFDMVLSRNAIDRRANNDKPVPPIKINRSVGLQVNFITEPGIQSLKALSSNNAIKTYVPAPKIVNGGNTTGSDNAGKTPAPPRRGIKVRSPRRAEVPKSAPLPVPPLTSTAAPTTYVVTKPADTSHNLLSPINSKEQILPNLNPVQLVAAKVQGIVINGKTSNQANRHVNVTNNHIAETNDLIDLTEEEDKNKSISHTTTSILPMVTTVTPSLGTKIPHNRYQRVVQGTIPGNVAITTQPTNIRVVQSVGQPTPTALVNNINAGRLAYVMQGTPGARGQLLITSNPNQIRPATSTTRGQFSNVAYKTGTSTLANGTVRVLTATAPPIPNTQPIPAPLPKTPHYQAKNGWKQPPPPPSVKISKVGQDIVLSWNMTQSEDYADIASYQLYAYQEIPGAPPNPNLWKKVGDVRALPLPMACTLKEFTPGNNYHFAVRAVDVHSRLGHYSIPRNISL